MRRQPIILAAFFALILATFAPIRAQESGDIVGAYGSDANVGISLLAEGDVGYETLDDLIRAKSGDGYTFLKDYERFRYDYFLKDIPDDDGYDSWYYYGCMIAKCSSSSGVSAWRRFVFYGELYNINNVWVAKKWFIQFGLPAYTGTNDYGMTYAEGQKFFAQYVACLEKYCELTGEEFNTIGQYDNYINYETYDSDKGGVNNLAEWIRGTSNNNILDDNRQGGDCVCGACCECKCLCGKWSALTCNGTATDCDCHIDCFCSTYCCECECKCEACEVGGTHGAHKNGESACMGIPGECDCHPESDCTCAYYCCKHTCACKKCGDGEHSAHKNGSATCDGAFEDCSDCHEEENPEEETCTCANYCCYHTCACPVHKDKSASEHSQHGNNSPTCDGTTGSGGCDCHETTDDEECACENYCCACKCECKKCKAAGFCSGNHKNGDSKCDGVSSGSSYVCDCHASSNPENPEETPCTCANYCCYHTCACKRCASLPAASHSQHKNGSPTCNGTTGSGGCDCHKDDFPEGDVPTAARNETFIENSEFDEHYRRLSNALEQKFGFSIFQRTFGNFQGDAKLPTFQTPRIFDRTGVTIDLNKAAENKTLASLRGILVAALWFFTFAHIFHSIRKIFG